MTNVHRTYLSLLAAGAILTAVGCGSSGSMAGPDAASAPSAASAAATIVGNVSGSAAASGVGASAMSGLRVSVVGTSIATATDGSGHFTLSGLSAGNVQIRFEGRGVDARLTVTGLVAGHTRTISVKVSGSSASLETSEDQDQVEFQGTISSLSPLTILSWTVMTDANTAYLGSRKEPLTAAEVLVVGNRVEVEGQQQSPGVVLAAKIKLETEQQEVEFKGTISSLSPLTIGSWTVMTDASTRYLGAKNEVSTSAEVLVVGKLVEVDGQQQSPGIVLATKIKLEEESEKEVEVKGTISSLSPLTIGSWTVMTDASTRYLGAKNESLTSAQVLVVGNKVEVEGQQQSPGVVLAQKIKLESDSDHSGDHDGDHDGDGGGHGD